MAEPPYFTRVCNDRVPLRRGARGLSFKMELTDSRRRLLGGPGLIDAEVLSAEAGNTSRMLDLHAV
jgi:hypothetical protein